MNQELQNLAPFCLTQIAIFISALCSFYLPILRIIGCNTNTPLYMCIGHFYIGSIFLLTLILNLLSYTHGFEIYQLYCSAQFRFFRNLQREHGIKTKVIKRGDVQGNIRIAQIFNKTFSLTQYFVGLGRMDRKYRQLDIMGILMTSVVPLLLVTTNMFPPVAVYLRFDPLDYLMEDFAARNISQEYFVIAARWIIVQWNCLEIGRSMALVLLPTIDTFNLTVSFLKTLWDLPPDEVSLKRYVELRCLQQLGIGGIRIQAGVFMGVGYILGVMGAWVVVMAWKWVPVWFYCIGCASAVITYVIILQTLPIICRCLRLSNKMLKVVWPNQSVKYWQKRYKGTEDGFESYRACYGKSVLWLNLK